MEKSKEMEEMQRGYRGGWGDLDGRHSACEPLITACREGQAEVIEQLLRAGADATLCTPQGRTALHACPPDLQGALLGWMLRPHLPPQAGLWRAAWLGDLRTLRQLLAGPDTLDLNAPNPDGLTALMLSVRDVDLMQVLVENRLCSPWQPRHGEVVRELLLLSVDVCIHDNRGWSALDYALNINGPQKDDIVHMLLKVLTKTESSPGPCLPLDRHSSSELRSEREGSGPEEPAPGQPTDGRPGSPRTTSRHSEGELLQTSEGNPHSHHNKMNRQDKRLPFCFQIAMETQSDIRQTDQDAERGSRGRGSSLPSLSEWNKPAVGQRESGTRSTRSRSPSMPGTPKQEHLDGNSRKQSQVSGSPRPVSGSPRLVLGPQQQTSCLLSQSAPSVMVPLLDSNTLLLARAHIHTRLGSHENDRNGTGRNSSMPAPPPHILPQLLAPLEGRTKGPMLVHQLLHPTPLKPIRGTPSRNLRTLLRRERLSRGSGPTTRGGSEESSSSSSNQSSIDLDDEVEEVERDLTSTYFLKADAVGRGIRAKTSGERLHLVRHGAMRDPIGETRDSIDIGKPLMSDSIRVGVITGQEVFENELKQLDSEREDRMINLCVENEMHHQIRSYPNEEYTSPACIKGTAKYINCDPDDRYSERQCRLGDGREVVVPSLGKNPHQSVNGFLGDGEEVKPCTVMTSATIAVVERSQYPKTTVNLTLSQKNCQRDFMTSPVKPVKTKERRTNGKMRNRATNSQFPQSFGILNGSKSKLDPKTNSVSATQVKTRVRKKPNLVINGEATVSSVKSKPNSVEVAQQNADTPVASESFTGGYRTYSKGPNSDRSNEKRPHVIPAARELRSAGQPKRTPVVVPSPRSKSVVDLITYKDMFQTINRGDDGPVIYEMFAGPMFDKLRISASCDQPKVGTVSMPPRKSHQTFKVKKQPLKKPVEHRKLRRSPAEKMVVSSTGKRKAVSASKVEPCLTAGQGKDPHKMEDDPKLDLQTQPESFQTEESEEEEEKYLEPSSDRGGDQMMSVIQEVQSGYGSETLKPDELSSARQMQRERSSRRHDVEDLQDGHELNPHNLRTSSAHSSRSRDGGETYHQVPEPVRSQSPQQTKINSRTSDRSNGTVSPVYRECLDEVGEGPMTDELLKCLAQELISLDETDTSIGPSPIFQPFGSRGKGEGPGRPKQKMPEQISSTLDSVVEDTITWTKGEVLGRGAYGTVFCGLTNQGTLIAVKQVSLDTSEPAAADREYGRLQEEVELLKNLTHTNIVGFLGTSLRQHMVSIFMEYVPGGSIASVLHRFGPLPEHVLSLYSHQILEGVAYLHLNRVIHRDLKGNNIMLMPTGVVKLIDFGCARRLSRLNPSSSHSADLIKSVHGTPYWMAPEVITESGYGRKSDIWSVGCTVFEMATGKPPLAHMDKLAALFYIGAQRGSMPSLPDGFSRHASNFVDVCLTSDQKLRPSAEQLLKHPFIPNKTRENSPETQRRPCCAAHPDGFCHW
ncbi:unnamed protein product [Gadus morhua 'NCC']